MATSPSNTATASSSATAIEVKHLADRLNVAQVKVKRLARLEASIVDFFMEIMERTAAMPTPHGLAQKQLEDDSAFAKAKRRDEYLKRAEGDPIALLNALRTHLRVQFTTHEQQHHDMQQTITKMTLRGERNAQDATDELRQWEAACETAQQQMRALAQQLVAAQNAHDRTTRQYARSLEQLNGELHALRATSESQREQLAKRQADIDELKHANDVLARDRKRVTDELARTGDHLRGTATGNGGSPLVGVATSGGLIGWTPAEQHNLKRVLQDYECKLSKLEATNDELRGEIQRQQQHVASVRQSTQAQHCAKLEKDVKKLREGLDDKTKRLAHQEAELLRTRGSLKEREALIRDMKDEYNKLFAAMQKIKQTPAQARPQLARSSSTSHIGLNNRSPSRAASAGKPPGRQTSSGETATATAELANENPYLLDHYKAKIEQQEKEIERLHTQLRKMIASEYRHRQKNKLFRVERVQLKDTCDSLRGELDRAVKTTAKAMAHHMPFLMGPEDDDTDANPGRDVKASSRARDPSISRGPEDDGEARSDDSDDDSDHSRRHAGNQFSCTIADVRRLKQRNQYLEERFRASAGDPPHTNGSPPKDSSSSAASRPPRPSSSQALGGSRQSASAVPIPTLALASERSIDATTMQALQQVRQSARARPQSAGPRAMLGAKTSAVVAKALL